MFSKDQFWPIISAIIALIALGVSIFQYYAQRKRKSLSCRLLAETELFQDIDEKFQITYDSRPVQNVFLIIIKVLNDGDMPIDEKDFSRTLTFSLGTDAQVLSAELIHASPENVKPKNPEINPQQSSVTVQPLNLNCKDEFDIKILCDRYAGNIQIDTHIRGGEVKFFQSSTLEHDYVRIPPYVWLFCIFLNAAFIGFITGAFEFGRALKVLWKLLGLTCIVVVLYFIFAKLMLRMKEKWRR